MGKELIKTDKPTSLAEKRIFQIEEELQEINNTERWSSALVTTGLLTSFLSLAVGFTSLNFALSFIFLIVFCPVLFCLSFFRLVDDINQMKRKTSLINEQRKEIDKFCLEEFGDEAAEYGLLPESTDSE